MRWRFSFRKCIVKREPMVDNFRLMARVFFQISCLTLCREVIYYIECMLSLCLYFCIHCIFSCLVPTWRINSSVLRFVFVIFAKALSIYFYCNLLGKQGSNVLLLCWVPTAWKPAIITPLFKDNLSSGTSNYRPVSPTGAFDKIMESVIASNILQYL